ncbi:MAG: hypothetical protein U0M06_13780 [Clostridia bacterium]|nr:hypothetical protein [Clostridia bacterium]
MNEVRTLLFLELRSLYGINKFLHTKDKKVKNRYLALGIVWVILIGMVFSYVGGLVYGLCSLGLSSIVPSYLTVLASILILAFGLFTAGARIFGQKGYDILSSLPLKPSSIVLSRFLSMYTEDLLLSVIIMLPGVTVYGFCQKPSFSFYPIALIAALFIPAIPLVISTLLGTLIFAISSKMKNKSFIQTFLMVFLVIGIMLASFGMQSAADDLTLDRLSTLAQSIGSLFEQIYPPVIWLNAAIMEQSVLSLMLFVLVSIIIIALTVFVVSKYFHSIVHHLMNFTAKHNYKIDKLESRSLLKSLYFREVKRYFSSSIYVTNTIIGPILATLMSVALCFVGVDTVISSLPITINVPVILPFVFSSAFCMMTTTSTSISMEGKHFWIIKSLPIPTKTFLDSKILLNLSIMLPFYIVSVSAMAICLKLTISQLMWFIFIPATLIIFSVVFGITVNLRFHSFDWEKEETIVKQSLSSMLGGFAGFLISILIGALMFLIPPQYDSAAKAVICLFLWVFTALLYCKNNTANLKEL